MSIEFLLITELVICALFVLYVVLDKQASKKYKEVISNYEEILKLQKTCIDKKDENIELLENRIKELRKLQKEIISEIMSHDEFEQFCDLFPGLTPSEIVGLYLRAQKEDDEDEECKMYLDEAVEIAEERDTWKRLADERLEALEALKKENAPVERDARLERILRENFSEEELAPRFREGDKPLEEVEGEVVDDVARFFKRVDDKMRSKSHY